jgi:hypothetical protein
MAERDLSPDDALRAAFAAVPDPVDGGFTAAVMQRVRARTRRRRLLIAAAVAVGALIAAWPLGQLLLQFSDGLRGLATTAAGTDWFGEHKTLLYGVALACLTPVVAALLEE